MVGSDGAGTASVCLTANPSLTICVCFKLRSAQCSSAGRIGLHEEVMGFAMRRDAP